MRSLIIMTRRAYRACLNVTVRRWVVNVAQQGRGTYEVDPIRSAFGVGVTSTNVTQVTRDRHTQRRGLRRLGGSRLSHA